MHDLAQLAGGDRVCKQVVLIYLVAGPLHLVQHPMCMPVPAFPPRRAGLNDLVSDAVEHELG